MELRRLKQVEAPGMFIGRLIGTMGRLILPIRRLIGPIRSLTLHAIRHPPVHYKTGILFANKSLYFPYKCENLINT